MSMVAKEAQCGIAVLPYMLDDADVFLLLLHYYVKQSLTSLDIGATVEKHRVIAPELSSCDTVACLCGIGKMGALETFKGGKRLALLGEDNVDILQVINEANRLILY